MSVGATDDFGSYKVTCCLQLHWVWSIYGPVYYISRKSYKQGSQKWEHIPMASGEQFRLTIPNCESIGAGKLTKSNKNSRTRAG